MLAHVTKTFLAPIVVDVCIQSLKHDVPVPVKQAVEVAIAAAMVLHSLPSESQLNCLSGARFKNDLAFSALAQSPNVLNTWPRAFSIIQLSQKMARTIWGRG